MQESIPNIEIYVFLPLLKTQSKGTKSKNFTAMLARNTIKKTFVTTFKSRP